MDFISLDDIHDGAGWACLDSLHLQNVALIARNEIELPDLLGQRHSSHQRLDAFFNRGIERGALGVSSASGQADQDEGKKRGA